LVQVKGVPTHNLVDILYAYAVTHSFPLTVQRLKLVVNYLSITLVVSIPVVNYLSITLVVSIPAEKEVISQFCVGCFFNYTKLSFFNKSHLSTFM